MTQPKQCPICRENYEVDRGLSFDGKGINSCGMYRTRLATFTSGCTGDDVSSLGPLFAAAPEMYEALQLALANLDPLCPAAHLVIRMIRAAIAKAEGR